MKISIINKPDDILGLAIKNLFTPFLHDEKFIKRINKLNRIIVLELIDVYPLTLTFHEGTIRIEYGENPDYDLKLRITVEAFAGIAEGKVGLIGALLKGNLKVKKIYRLLTVLKFYRILFPAIKKATETPILEGVINIL